MSKSIAKRKPTGYVIYRGPSMLDGQPIVVVALTGSTNRKTGNMVQTYILRDGINPVEAVRAGLDASICGNCRHRGDGTGKGRSCYVTLIHGPSSVHRGLERGIYPTITDGEALEVLAMGRMVRLGTYGDPAAVPVRVWWELTRNAKGWTGYTHQWQAGARMTPVRAALFRELVMASCDTPEEQREAIKQGWRTFRVRADGEAIMPNEITCPASDEAGKRTTCADCRLCMGTSVNTRKVITIKVHGAGRSNFA